jgi:hypothetical protein
MDQSWEAMEARILQAQNLKMSVEEDLAVVRSKIMVLKQLESIISEILELELKQLRRGI